jgi:hypothetical protein|tara:strand:- start:31 stop:252 length:222 start_codon:yes stop_codon:yes gene_type:complete
MSKRLKNGIYTARLSGGNVRYFVHDGLIIMNSKYGNYKTTENFMLGSQYSVNPEPLNVSPNEFLEAYNKLENW